jgi:hypothetical protein
MDKGYITFTDANTFEMPRYSKWQCFMFGTVPGNGMVWRPLEGKEPNFFWRWMQYLAFGNRWVKDEG